MKEQNRTSFKIFLSLFILVTVLSIAAYTSLKKGEHPQKPKNILHRDGGGPLKFSTSLDNEYYFDNDHVYLYINLQAGKADITRERSPLNIAIVIDKSGSMGDKNKLDYVKRAVDYIIDQLGSDDYLSVVTYDDEVNVLQSSSRVTDKYDLREKISKIKPGGFTNLSGGTFEGYEQVSRSYSRGYVNRVLLLSDGLANRGITDRYELADMVRDKSRRDGITISTFGVGNDFNENLMADLGEYGKGNYYYISNSRDIPGIFEQELKSVSNLVAQGTRIKVHFPSQYLSLNKVFGFPYEVSGNEVDIDFKDVFSEQTKSVLVKFDVIRKIDSRISFESELVYDDVGSDFRHVSSSDDKYLEPANSREEYNKGYDENVVQNISMFESNDMMENALKESDNGNYDRARIILQDAQQYMNKQMEQVPTSPGMIQQSETMDKYKEQLRSAESKTDDEKKDMQKSGKYDNYNTRKGNK